MLFFLNHRQWKAAHVSCSGFSSKAPDCIVLYYVNWVWSKFILPYGTVHCTVYWQIRDHKALDLVSHYTLWPRIFIWTQKSPNFRKHIRNTNQLLHWMLRAKQCMYNKSKPPKSWFYWIGCEQAMPLSCLALNFVLKQPRCILLHCEPNVKEVYFPIWNSVPIHWQLRDPKGSISFIQQTWSTIVLHKLTTKLHLNSAKHIFQKTDRKTNPQLHWMLRTKQCLYNKSKPNSAHFN